LIKAFTTDEIDAPLASSRPIALAALLLTMILGIGCSNPQAAGRSQQPQPANPRAVRAAAIKDTLATYCGAPRDKTGRVDVDRLVAQLSDLHANTYSFCIHQYATDWDDLKLILPRARAKGIRIWASIVPPSESPPRLKMYAEPFRLDYERWAVEFAKLSLDHPNLVAWSIDDFTHNLKIYTPDFVRRMLEASRAINPKLAFVPCCYYPSITPQFVTNYCGTIDGILFPYRHESAGSNLTDPTLVELEIKKLKALTGDFPIILDLYASPHSRLGATTAEYLETAIIAGQHSADGVMIYRHQDPRQNPEKYRIIKRLFAEWKK
jgi:hypothetical protein